MKKTFLFFLALFNGEVPIAAAPTFTPYGKLTTEAQDRFGTAFCDPYYQKAKAQHPNPDLSVFSFKEQEVTRIVDGEEMHVKIPKDSFCKAGKFDIPSLEPEEEEVTAPPSTQEATDFTPFEELTLEKQSKFEEALCQKWYERAKRLSPNPDSGIFSIIGDVKLKVDGEEMRVTISKTSQCKAGRFFRTPSSEPLKEVEVTHYPTYPANSW